MKKPVSLKTFIILTSTMIISSCGGGNSVFKKTFSVDALISEEHPIANDERNIATRICYAYQSKSKNFRSSGFIGTSFIFSGKKTDCQNNITNYQINSILKYDDNNQLIYSTPSTFDPNLKFHKKVQTDNSGYLAQLCSKIINNEPISNTFDQQGVKVQLSFFREGFDGFLLQYFIKQPDNTYKIDSAEKLKIRTQIDFTNGKILGMDEFYSAQKVCGSQFDKNKFSEFEQNFISR
ncbi:MAG: hypothetical protein H7281_14050 [Bacteriovorax sp.]|nr:hypothetical protein [Bacteriovorax sp.]